MNNINFDWDDRKSILNQKKHNVSFEEAKTVFYDENAIEFYDEKHSALEDRFLLLGVSYKSRILLVCHCVREKGTMIRIISARKATKLERKQYGSL